MCPGVSQALSLDGDVTTFACLLEVLLALRRGQRHALPVRTGTGTRSAGISLPLLDGG